jgi:16S rRNA (cytosine1402-N4)-methyltransferase
MEIRALEWSEGGPAPQGRQRESEAVPHQPVLREEVLELVDGLDPAALEGWIVDATLGPGGHAAAILERFPRVKLLGTDQDPDALALAQRRLAPHAGRVRIRRARLSELGRTLRKERIGRPVALLLDLGASSLQLDRPERGFSFQDDGPLDMRMDPARDRTAADIVNTWDESDLADLFFYEGDEPKARRIARAIVEARRRAPFLRTASPRPTTGSRTAGACSSSPSIPARTAS